MPTAPIPIKCRQECRAGCPVTNLSGEAVDVAAKEVRICDFGTATGESGRMRRQNLCDMVRATMTRSRGRDAPATARTDCPRVVVGKRGMSACASTCGHACCERERRDPQQCPHRHKAAVASPKQSVQERCDGARNRHARPQPSPRTTANLPSSLCQRQAVAQGLCAISCCSCAPPHTEGRTKTLLSARSLRDGFTWSTHITRTPPGKGKQCSRRWNTSLTS